MQIEEEGRLQLEALDRRSRHRILLPVGHEEPWSIIMDDLLNLGVKLASFSLFGGGAGFLQQSIDFGV